MTNTRDSSTFLKVKVFLKKFALEVMILAYQLPSKLRFVNIYFDTPTFDKITKDRSAKESLNVYNI